MALVQRIDGSLVPGVELTAIEQVGDEGARRALAHINGDVLPVYNTIIDGFSAIWYEQITFAQYKEMLLEGVKSNE